MSSTRLTPSMRALLAFEASAKHESFTLAAEELSITQGAISRQVKGLETDLGVDLFLRVGRNVVLTDVGRMYFTELSVALAKVRDATLQAIAYRSDGGSIHLACLPAFGSKWLLPRLPDFYGKHPGVLVHIHSKIGHIDFERSGLDAAITVGDGQWTNGIAHHLADEVLVPIVVPGSDMAKRIRKPRDLLKHLLLEVASRPTAWRDWFAAQGVVATPPRGPQFELTSHLIQAVIAQLGVGLVPRLFVEDELRNGSLSIPVHGPSPAGRAYYLIVNPRRVNYPPMQAFQNWLTKAT
jgi:LysR family glycine cleavage system transcriptional activator